MGGRAVIAQAVGVSRGAVDRYTTGHGMRQETFDRLSELVRKHVDEGEPVREQAVATQAPADPSPLSPSLPRGRLDEPEELAGPTLEDEGGHLYQLLVRALERSVGLDSISAQLNRMEERQQRLEANQVKLLRAWQMGPVR